MKSDRKTSRVLGIAIPAILLALALFFLFYTQYHLGGGGIESPQFNLQAVLLAALTVINILFILVMVLILSRYIVKTFFDKKGKRLFASVKTKLALSFMILAVVPTGFFVFFSYEVINESVSQWFSAPAEELLRHAEEVARAYYLQAIEGVRSQMADFLAAHQQAGFTWDDLVRFRRQNRLDLVSILDQRGRVLLRDGESKPGQRAFRVDDPSLIFQNLRPGDVSYYVENHPDEDLIVCFTPHPAVPGQVVVAIRRIAGSVAYRAFWINEAYQQYFQLKNQVELIRVNYFFIVGFASVVLLFAFMWFGLYISKKITVPILALVDGSQRVAAGDLQMAVDYTAGDEFGVLVSSFNRMTGELRRNKEVIEQANEELTRFNRELEQRNTFIQTVLDTIATGVVSIDPEMTITISNASASHLLKQRRIQDGATQLREVLPAEKVDEILRLIQEAEFQPRVSREIVFQAGKRTMNFAVTASQMKDPEGRKTGTVMVFDDVSELMKTERAAAWQEVAKRLAHQIKNPLTPIQLSMERIRKQYARLLEEGSLPPSAETRLFSEILEESLQTAQTETRTLKYLVEEFSQFARLPAPNLQPMDLNELLEDVASRSRQARPDIGLQMQLDESLPLIYADRELIRNVLMNLIDNAVESIDETEGGGQIDLGTRHDPGSNRVLLWLQDNGRGISEEIWEHLFLPYFSTKEHGMGLGLAIVKKILDDHDAGIRIDPAVPSGCRLELEFRKIKSGEK